MSEDCAAGFLRELVKSDPGNEYGMELRRWIEELEVNLSRRVFTSGEAVPNGTTRIIPVRRELVLLRQWRSLAIRKFTAWC
ncbi:MAG UNVERIFIED_CONTAM: hypothetical protein LVR18_34500 [Planctomycetaceae bacterium]